MAVRFAVSSTNWSNPATWDDGIGPVAGDTVYPNGFTVPIDTDVTIGSLNNNISPVYLPGMPIPKMTGNTQPSGIVNAGTDTTNAWKAFDHVVSGSNWSGTGVSAVNSTAWLSYQFPAGQSKTIKRYYLFRIAQNANPISWIFQGSNNGTNWDDLETVTSNTAGTPYLSGILPNITAYLYYRIIVTAVSSGTTVFLYNLEMTESTAITYGVTTGGSFTVPASLSGNRTITQTGAGIVSNNVLTTGIVQTNHIAGNIVNFNVQSGGYIINPTWVNGNTSNVKAVAINGNGTINFNGNIWGHTGVIYNDILAASIYINANAIVTVNGNVYAPAGNATSDSYTILSAVTTSASAILNINGDIIGSGTTIRSFPIFLNSTLTVNIVGNLTSNKGYCLQSTFGNLISIIGNVTVTDTLSANAIYLTSLNSLITMNGSITNKGNLITIWVPKIRFASTATPYWIFQTNAGTDMTLAYGSAIGSFPAEADVKLGVTYAASPIRTGTCAVPLPQYVSQGVATGSTVGTAYLNAADVWNILTSTITTPGSVGKLISDNLNETVSSRASQTSIDTANTNINNLPGNTADAVWNEATSGITTVGSIGERLKNASTVQTNGDQLAAYIV